MARKVGDSSRPRPSAAASRGSSVRRNGPFRSAIAGGARDQQERGRQEAAPRRREDVKRVRVTRSFLFSRKPLRRGARAPSSWTRE
jgi:hypothetical protein